ncbi:MAG: choice-of-anchor Q domain-containing protein [Chloroflexota bacterium]
MPDGSNFGISSAGFNLSSDYSCPFNQTGDQEGVDPRLGPLADNGGFTQTHMLLPDSPAIDAGQCMPDLTTDQRGLPRLQGGTCDIGAVERQPGDSLSKVYLPFVIK